MNKLEDTKWFEDFYDLSSRKQWFEELDKYLRWEVHRYELSLITLYIYLTTNNKFHVWKFLHAQELLTKLSNPENYKLIFESKKSDLINEIKENFNQILEEYTEDWKKLLSKDFKLENFQ